MTANCITLSRILFSVLMLHFSPQTILFAALYLLCGITDVLDGFAARKLHTESEKGAILDSAADLLFALVYAVRILPLLAVPNWIRYWAEIIAVIKLAGIIFASKKVHKLTIGHSFGNKLTGLLLYLLPLSICAIPVKYGAALACIVATGTFIEETANLPAKIMR